MPDRPANSSLAHEAFTPQLSQRLSSSGTCGTSTADREGGDDRAHTEDHRLQPQPVREQRPLNHNPRHETDTEER